MRLTDSVLMLSASTCDELLEETDGGEAGVAPPHGDCAAAAAGEQRLSSGLASRRGLASATPMPIVPLWE